MHYGAKLAGESFRNLQFYSIPDIDNAMNHQSQKGFQKGSKRGPRQERVKEILEGTYEFPSDIDNDTLLLLEESARIFIAIFLTTKDFQDWWLSSDEDV